MTCFRYYLPGTATDDVSDELLERVGLAARLWDCLGRRRDQRLGISEVVAKGPDGSSGALVIPLPASGELPQRHGWAADMTATEFDGYWIISDPTDPPTPGGLERPEIVDGHVRELGDGSAWLCPILRSEFDKSDLPRSYLQDGDDIIAVIQPRYRRLFVRSIKWCVRFVDSLREVPFTRLLGVDEAFRGAVECLALNYRISGEELALLGDLMTDETIDSILAAAINWDFYNDLDQKKTASLAAASARLESLLHGPEDGSQPTGQHAPTSSDCAEDTAANTPAGSSSSDRGA